MQASAKFFVCLAAARCSDNERRPGASLSDRIAGLSDRIGRRWCSPPKPSAFGSRGKIKTTPTAIAAGRGSKLGRLEFLPIVLWRRLKLERHGRSLSCLHFGRHSTFVCFSCEPAFGRWVAGG